MGQYPGWIFRNTVEDCKRLSIKAIKPVFQGKASTVNLTWHGRRSDLSPIEVEVRWNYDGRLAIAYSDGEGFSIELRIECLLTPSNLGRGYRYWFACPGLNGDLSCQRRVGTLYLPPGARYFACRKCYALPYWDQLRHVRSNGEEQLKSLRRYLVK